MPQGVTWLEALETVLRPVFAPIPLVWANQNGPRPKGLYVVMRIDGAMRRLPTNVGSQNSDGVRDVSTHRVGTLEFQAFGMGSYDLLDKATQTMTHESVRAALYGINTSIGPVGSIIDEPALRDTHEWEPRAIASVPVSYTLRTGETVPWIEAVEGVVSVDGTTATQVPDVPFKASVVDN